MKDLQYYPYRGSTTLPTEKRWQMPSAGEIRFLLWLKVHRGIPVVLNGKRGRCADHPVELPDRDPGLKNGARADRRSCGRAQIS